MTETDNEVVPVADGEVDLVDAQPAEVAEELAPVEESVTDSGLAEVVGLDQYLKVCAFNERLSSELRVAMQMLHDTNDKLVAARAEAARLRELQQG